MKDQDWLLKDTLAVVVSNVLLNTPRKGLWAGGETIKSVVDESDKKGSGKY